MRAARRVHRRPFQYRDAGDVFPNNGAHAWTLAVGAADLDRDGLSDLYIANDFGPDQLLWNHSTPGSVHLEELKGEKGFSRPSSMSIGNDTFKSMSIDFADINNDGIFDMYVSNIASRSLCRKVISCGSAQARWTR